MTKMFSQVCSYSARNVCLRWKSVSPANKARVKYRKYFDRETSHTDGLNTQDVCVEVL